MTMATKYKTYPKYKPSGIEWLGDIPERWEVKRLKYMCSRSVDYGLNIEAENYQAQGIRFIRTSDIDDEGYLSEEGVYLNPNLVPFDYLLFDGDILLSRSGTIGRSYVCSHLDEKSTYAGYLVRFRSQKNRLKTKFAYYFFHSKTFFDWIKTQLIETTIGNVNGQKYANIPIQLPICEEQQFIADFLDRETVKIDEVVSKKQKLIDLLKEKRQALITHAVIKGLDPKAKMKPSGIDWLGDIPEGWGVKRLKYISNPRVSNVDKKSEDEIAVKLCNYIDVYKNEFIDEDIAFMEATAKSNQIEIFELKQGDVIITKDSETPDDIGVPAYVKLKNTKNVICGYHLAIITSNRALLLGKYLFRLFQSKLFRSYFEVNCNGVTRYGLDTYSIFNVNILLPSLPEQQSIVDYIDQETAKIDEMMKKVEIQIEKLQEYRQALITNTVTGKIMVN